MPNIKSAKKRVLIAKVNNERNKAGQVRPEDHPEEVRSCCRGRQS